jgi:DNA replication and repair protein RecF
MIIERMYLKNFRNYDEILIDLNDKLNFIIGQNAQGKTNLLEGMYLGAIGKSFRTRKDIELIKNGENSSDLKYILVDNEIKIKLEIELEKNKKNIKINNNNIKRLHELFGTLYVVVFTPDNINLIKNGPNERRTFLDREISLISKGYLEDIIKYNKIINNRNNLLKNKIFDYESYEIWDIQLTKVAKRIFTKRMNFIEKLNNYGNERVKNISKDKDEIEIIYKNSIVSFENFEKEYMENLKNGLSKDLEFKYTRYGIHRDDFQILINGKDSKIYASQGQMRTISIALILSEIDIIKYELNKKAVILLDDVFSELDIERKNNLIELLKEHQVIITATDLMGINQELINNSKVFNIKDAHIV